jgi:hypothetical protein
MTDNTTAIIEAATSITDSVDALSADQRSLLVFSSLNAIEKTLSLITEKVNEPAEVFALATLADGVARLASYAQDRDRETAGFTSTGDAKVDLIFSALRSLITASATAQMSDEERAAVETITAETREEVARTGRSEQEVLDEKLAAYRAKQPQRAAAGFAPQEPAPTKSVVGEPAGYGQYL